LALVATAVAVLSITAQWARLVTALTTAVKVAFSAKSTPRKQFSVCDPTFPLTVHPAEARHPSHPAATGSGSLNVPFFHAWRELVTTMVNVAVLPARSSHCRRLRNRQHRLADNHRLVRALAGLANCCCVPL
jgi:hypothetical protein